MLELLAKEDPNYWLGKEFNLKMKRLNTLSLGIIGLGRIGGSIAKKFSSFSRKISFMTHIFLMVMKKFLILKDVKTV